MYQQSDGAALQSCHECAHSQVGTCPDMTYVKVYVAGTYNPRTNQTRTMYAHHTSHTTHHMAYTSDITCTLGGLCYRHINVTVT